MMTTERIFKEKRRAPSGWHPSRALGLFAGATSLPEVMVELHFRQQGLEFLTGPSTESEGAHAGGHLR